MKWFCVNPDNVGYFWPRVVDGIRRACQRGDLGTYEELRRAVMCGDALLWLAVDDYKIWGAAITQIIRTEKSKVCMVHACAGERRNEWIGFISHIEAYAKQMRCDCVRLMGRKGWQRILPQYRASKIILERRLDGD